MLLFLVGFWTIQPESLIAQECKISISGSITDPHENLLLEFASVYMEESNQYAETDSNGFYFIKNICPGAYHLIINHIGCETQKLFVHITKDTIIHIELEHHAHFLQSVTVKSNRNRSESATQNTIKSNELNKEAGKPLASILEKIPGVYSIKNGSGIAKPVIHGLTGNRVSILNNGIVQAGQQWGSDHAPEIDPFIAQQITVIKGVDVIAYGGNSLGGLILMEPGPIDKDPHFHGSTQVNYQTNGNQIYLASKVEQSTPVFDWRLTAGIKRSGDHKSPEYYLTNTGMKEYSSSIEWNKDKPGKFQHHIYYSLFHSEPGILRGSHIGNLTDLQSAIGAQIPYFTKDHFSYRIESPRQSVTHHLLKLNHQWTRKNQFHEIVYAAQLNHRKEFDVRRGSRSDIPSLDLLLQSYVTEYKSRINLNQQEINYGIQYKFTYNRNQPGTGIFPLIPDYLLHNEGVFMNWKYHFENTSLELGSRYDLSQLNVDYYSTSGVKTIQNAIHLFKHFSLAGGIKYNAHNFWNIRFNGGITQRSPEVNELYSYGLHQAVAGIEEGNKELKNEHALKLILTNTISLGSFFNMELSTYYQAIRDFIYLEPQKEFRLTIRGAFPLFLYKQTDARIYGLDALFRIEFNSKLQWVIQYSYLNGYDFKNHRGLVYMPPNQFGSSLFYHLKSIGRFKNVKFEMQGKYVFEQLNLETNQELLIAPPAYFLISPSIETEIKLFSKKFKINAQVENLLNRNYRDYLNRLRYFAAEEGINFRLNLKMEF
ncbi:MAG: TonB-dependent receptor [Saprospiraceae bacterium]